MPSQNSTVVGVFESDRQAREAVHELKNAGFTEEEIGIVHPGDHSERESRVHHDDAEGSSAESGAATGAIAGVGLGTLWGLGVLAGVLPAIGPAIAGGTLAALLSSAAAGAAAAGLAGALIGMGIPKDEAEFYESEMKSGRTIVTVKAGARRDEAEAIIRRYSGYDMKSRPAVRQQSAASASKTASLPRHSASAADTSASRGGNKLQAREEKLHIEKTPVETGNVTVRKEVHTEHQTVDVPVTREEVVIERRPVSGAESADGSIAAAQEIRIPVREEQVNVSKETVVAEEVSVGKRQVRDTERVAENLRKEEIKVEKHGDVDVKRT